MISFTKKFTIAIPIIGVLVVTLFSHLVYPGYDVFIGDHKVYMPAILKALNPGLYASDPLLAFSHFSHGSYSLFDELIMFLMEITGMELFTVLFFISLILRLVFFFSIYQLSMYLTKDKVVSLILVLFFCAAQVKFGSLITYVLARSFGLVLGLLSLTLYFGQKRLSSSIVLSICLLFHPVFFVQFAGFFYLALLVDYKYKLITVKHLFLGLVPVAFLLVQLSQSSAADLGMLSQMSEQYYMFIKERTPDVFLLSADGMKVIYVYLFNYILFGFALYKVAGQVEAQNFRYLVLILLVTLAMLVVTIVGVDLFKSVFVFRIQTMRAYQLLKIFSAILFVYCTYIQIKTRPSDFMINLMFIGTTASLIVLQNLALLLLILTFVVLLLRRCSTAFYNPPYSYWLLICNAVCVLIFMISLFIGNDVYSAIKMIIVLLFMSLTALFIRKVELSLVIKPALFIVFVSAFALTLANANKFSVKPKYYNDKNFMEVCRWIQTNTDVDAVFLTEPFTSKGEEIRITCSRSIFATFKNAAPGVFNEKIAMEWTERYAFVKQFMKKITRCDTSRSPSFFYEGSKPVIPMMRNWYQKKANATKGDIEKILSSSPETELFIQKVMQRYKVDYILSEIPLLLNFPITFRNDGYIIYKLSLKTTKFFIKHRNPST